MIPNLIVPVLNRYDLLRRMLASLDYPIRDLLIIDNGGKFEDLFARDELPVKNLRVLNLPSNLGVAASWNLGIKLFPHDNRWTFASNDVVFEPGALSMLSTASSDSLTLSDRVPYWQTFAVGEGLVDRVGLFDERFMPAYFEDNDFERRVKLAGLPVTKLPLNVRHDNSSTLKADPKLQEANNRTFVRNKKLYARKKMVGDSGWSWTLRDARAGDWLR